MSLSKELLRIAGKLQEIGTPKRGSSPHHLSLAAFRTGYCAEFACALQEFTGKPLGAFVQLAWDDDEHEWYEQAIAHAFVYMPDGSVMDVDGVQDKSVMADRIVSDDGTRIVERRMTYSEMSQLGQLVPDALQEAREIISANLGKYQAE